MCHFFLTHRVLQGQKLSCLNGPHHMILHYVISFAKITAQDCKPLKGQIFFRLITPQCRVFLKNILSGNKEMLISAKYSPEKDSSSLEIYLIRVECQIILVCGQGY